MLQTVPLVKEIKTSHTAEEIFSLLVNDELPFWLDSSLSGSRTGRFTYLGSNPFLTFRTHSNRVSIKENNREKTFTSSPFTALRNQLQRFNLRREGVPFPFIGGAVGFFSYDLGRSIEKLPARAKDDMSIPDICLGFYSTFVAIDHKDNRTYLISSGLPAGSLDSNITAREALHMWEKKIIDAPAANLDDPWQEKNISSDDIKSNFNRQSYCEAVQKVKDYIFAGDVYQVNLTRRLEAPLLMEPFQLYRRLRRASPAPFAAYLDCGHGLRLLSSSPERFLLATNDGTVETRPIKGTRPRGKTPEEDMANRLELLNSEKDKAELLMIIDLERNDLGRVCSYGSVRVPELFALEQYANVFHLVSTVSGKLAPGKDLIDLLKASFPGGSITGAPKIRSMEIIEELEPVRRGCYTGSIGYIGFDGAADLNIAIRTIVNKGKRLHLQVGGGIVADSDPQAEYEETVYKASAMLHSLGANRQEGEK